MSNDKKKNIEQNLDDEQKLIKSFRIANQRNKIAKDHPLYKTIKSTNDYLEGLIVRFDRIYNETSQSENNADVLKLLNKKNNSFVGKRIVLGFLLETFAHIESGTPDDLKDFIIWQCETYNEIINNLPENQLTSFMETNSIDEARAKIIQQKNKLSGTLEAIETMMPILWFYYNEHNKTPIPLTIKDATRLSKGYLPPSHKYELKSLEITLHLYQVAIDTYVKENKQEFEKLLKSTLILEKKPDIALINFIKSINEANKLNLSNTDIEELLTDNKIFINRIIKSLKELENEDVIIDQFIELICDKKNLDLNTIKMTFDYDGAVKSFINCHFHCTNKNIQFFNIVSHILNDKLFLPRNNFMLPILKDYLLYQISNFYSLDENLTAQIKRSQKIQERDKSLFYKDIGESITALEKKLSKVTQFGTDPQTSVDQLKKSIETAKHIRLKELVRKGFKTGKLPKTKPVNNTIQSEIEKKFDRVTQTIQNTLPPEHHKAFYENCNSVRKHLKEMVLDWQGKRAQEIMQYIETEVVLITNYSDESEEKQAERLISLFSMDDLNEIKIHETVSKRLLKVDPKTKLNTQKRTLEQYEQELKSTDITFHKENSQSFRNQQNYSGRYRLNMSQAASRMRQAYVNRKIGRVQQFAATGTMGKSRITPSPVHRLSHTPSQKLSLPKANVNFTPIHPQMQLLAGLGILKIAETVHPEVLQNRYQSDLMTTLIFGSTITTEKWINLRWQMLKNGSYFDRKHTISLLINAQKKNYSHLSKAKILNKTALKFGLPVAALSYGYSLYTQNAKK